MASNDAKDILSYLNAVSSIFKKKWDQMEENSRFLRLDQYSTKQLQAMEKGGRVPYVMDRLNATINTFQGIQRDRRTEIAYYPVEAGDELKCEVLNSLKDSVLHKNNFTYLESDVFLDGLVQKLGATGYEWSREKDKNGSLSIFKIPPKQLMWDVNTPDYEKEECTWVSRRRLYTKSQVAALRPEFKKRIEKINLDDSEPQNLGLNASFYPYLVDNENGLISLLEFYRRIYEKRWFIQNVSVGIVYPKYYDTKKDAEEKIREFKKTEPQVEFTVFDDIVPLVEKTELAHDVVLETKILDEPFIPIDIYHPFFFDCDWWCPLDLLKDPQRYSNKMFALVDHWIGTMAKGTLLISKRAPKGEAKEVEKMFGKTGGVIYVQDPKNYTLLESRGPAPQMFEMMDRSREVLEDNAGGRNYQGKKETASESGVAVRTRIEQGSLSGYVNYDNLRRWKLQVGKHVEWYLTTYMKYAQTVRIMGEEQVQETLGRLQTAEQKMNIADATNWFKPSKLQPGMGFLEINTTEHNTVEGLQTDVIVDEARWSVSKNDALMQELSQLMQSNPVLAQTFPPEVLIKVTNLPFSLKQQAIAGAKRLMDFNQQKELAQQQKPPAISASLKDMLALPPEVQQEFIQKFFGIAGQILGGDAQGQIDTALKAKEFQLKQAQAIQAMTHKEAEHAQKMSHAEEKQSMDHLQKLHSLKQAEVPDAVPEQ